MTQEASGDCLRTLASTAARARLDAATMVFGTAAWCLRSVSLQLRRPVAWTTPQ